VRTRDHLANVRTTLVWVRTGLLLMAAGYALDKVTALDRLRGIPGTLVTYGRPAGLAAVLAGVAVAAAALPRFLAARAHIESDRLETRPDADLLLVGVLGAGALALLVLLAVAR
jgi:uncharacterized membrane protein YidH (DUF202 family)